MEAGAMSVFEWNTRVEWTLVRMSVYTNWETEMSETLVRYTKHYHTLTSDYWKASTVTVSFYSNYWYLSISYWRIFQLKGDVSFLQDSCVWELEDSSTKGENLERKRYMNFWRISRENIPRGSIWEKIEGEVEQ